MRRTVRRAVAASILLGVLAVEASATEAAIDPHELFEARCARCHDHAGAFARARLEIVDGGLISRASQRAVEPFLRGHMGQQTAPEVAALVDMMQRQIALQGLYDERCRICHDRARELARLQLIVEEGMLRGRYTGRDIASFLLSHGRSTPEEAARLTEMLRWQRDVLR